MRAVVRRLRSWLGEQRVLLSGRRQPGLPAALVAVRRAHPRFTTAVVADLRVTAAFRGERASFRSKLDIVTQILRLIVVTDSFFAQICYRAKAACQAHGIPGIPRLFHRLAIAHGQICIGDLVVVEPGVYIPHGQVVAAGITRIGSRAALSPFVTIGLRSGVPYGPTLRDGVYLGTGAKVFGPVTLGPNARIGANAVVTADVPAGATAVGVPAAVVGRPGTGGGGPQTGVAR